MPDLKPFLTRLTDGLVTTCRVRLSYLDPPEFRRNLNAALEALRSTTWVLQKACNGDSKLEAWYRDQQEWMRKDEIMRWLVSTRNRVVKQGDLDSHSTA